jgi:phosphonate transport system substrate-binding protein
MPCFQSTHVNADNLRKAGAVAGLWVFLTLAGAIANGQCSLKMSAPSPQARLNVILSEQLFSVANRNDVVSAMKLWMEFLACQGDLNFNYNVEVINTQREIRQRVHDKTVDMLILDNVEFLDLSDAGLIDGVGVSSYAGHPSELSYLLLVNRQIDSLAELRGKQAVLYMHTGSAASLAWTATLISENHLGRIDDFFKTVEPSTKASNCILPLFFDKVQACVVDSRDWEMAKELNPQLGNKLKILSQSIPVLDGIIALSKAPSPYRERTLVNLFQTHKRPLGNQILLALRSGPIIPYRPEYLNSTREFWKRYERTLTLAEKRTWSETLRAPKPSQLRAPSSGASAALKE